MMPQILALNHHVPWDSSLSCLTFMIFMNPSADGGITSGSPSPRPVGKLKVMSAERAEIQGRTNTTEVKEKGSYSPLSTTAFDIWGD